MTSTVAELSNPNDHPALPQSQSQPLSDPSAPSAPSVPPASVMPATMPASAAVAETAPDIAPAPASQGGRIWGLVRSAGRTLWRLNCQFALAEWNGWQRVTRRGGGTVDMPGGQAIVAAGQAFTSNVVVRRYKTAEAYQHDAVRMAALGFQATSVVQETRRSGCMRIFLLGLFALVFPPKPMFVVTYTRTAVPGAQGQ